MVKNKLNKKIIKIIAIASLLTMLTPNIITATRFTQSVTSRDPDTSAETQKYENIFTTNASSVSGTVQWGFKEYKTGKSCTSSSSAVPSASVIKVFIMEYIYANNLDLQKNVGGSTIKQLVEKMITISDNTATNTLINHIGMSTLNSYFSGQGYADTKLERRMLEYPAR